MPRAVLTRNYWRKTCWRFILKPPSGGVFDVSVLIDRPGFVSLHVEGKGAKALFANEAGGHRWQRVSPTEKRGRVHTSTVTVAVLEERDMDFKVDKRDIKYITTKGTGPGGQHRNKTESCVIAIHKPTGLSVKIDARNQHKNKALATRLLVERVREQERSASNRKRHTNRKQQVGSGMRGDKRRTYRSRDNRVVDHITGQKWRLSRWVRGEW